MGSKVSRVFGFYPWPPGTNRRPADSLAASLRGMTLGTSYGWESRRRNPPKPPQEAQNIRETRQAMTPMTMTMEPTVCTLNPVDWTLVVNRRTAPMAMMMTPVETPTDRSQVNAAGDNRPAADQVPTAGAFKQVR